MKTLDSEFQRVKHFAIYGLKKLEGSLVGQFEYPGTTTALEEEIRRLKAVFKAKTETP